MSNPLYTLRQQLARLMGETLIGAPAALPAPLQVDSFGVAALAVYEDNYFLDWQGRFYDGTHKDTDFVVTASAKLNGVLTFGPVLSSIVGTTDRFEMYLNFTPQEFNDAINLSISMVENVALEDTEPQHMPVVGSTFEYPVPSNLAYIESIHQDNVAAGRYSVIEDRVDGRAWQVLRGGSPRIWFDNQHVSLIAGRSLRIIGQKTPSQLVLDADESNISQAYIIYQAKALLHQSRIRGRGADFEEHNAQMVLAQGMADRERVRLAVPGRGQKVSF